MKKLMMTLMAAVFAITANAQYNVGTSSKYTDSFGNSTSTHRNQYGMTTGTSSSFSDGYGTTTTTHRDSYGNTSWHCLRCTSLLRPKVSKLSAS